MSVFAIEILGGISPLPTKSRFVLKLRVTRSFELVEPIFKSPKDLIPPPLVKVTTAPGSMVSVFPAGI